nr:Hypothetical protein CBG13276 [Haemonchus contortus]
MYDEIVQLTEQQPHPSTSRSSRMDESSSHHSTAPPPYTANRASSQSAVKRSSCSSKCSPVCQLAMLLLFYSVVFLAAAVISTLYIDTFLSYYATLWTGAISLVNSLVGVIAGISNNDRLLMVHLFLSVASTVAYVVCGVICWMDFLKIGTVAWCEENRHFCDYSMFCLLPSYDHLRIRHIYNYSRTADFTECASLFKAGTSSPFVFIIGVGIGALLSVCAVICSFTSIERWSKPCARFSGRATTIERF